MAITMKFKAIVKVIQKGPLYAPTLRYENTENMNNTENKQLHFTDTTAFIGTEIQTKEEEIKNLRFAEPEVSLKNRRMLISFQGPLP